MYYIYYIYFCFTTGNTGSVQWNDDINRVRLTRPSVVESEDVVSKLIKEEQTGK